MRRETKGKDLTDVEKLSRTILYEGYSLFPFGSEAIKNLVANPFGVLYPADYFRLHSKEVHSSMQTECVIKGNENTSLQVRLRFMLITRQPVIDGGGNYDEKVEASFQRAVGDIGRHYGRNHRPMISRTEREIRTVNLKIASLLKVGTLEIQGFVPGKKVSSTDDIDSTSTNILGTFRMIRVSINISVNRLSTEKGLYKLTIRVANMTESEGIQHMSPRQALELSFHGTHTIVKVTEGGFLSIMDTSGEDEETAQFVKDCKNIHTWPILMGKKDQWMLSLPIILYDHPKIAAQSTGDLFEATEIEEYLLLHLLTLSEDERQRISGTDPMLRPIIQRVKDLNASDFGKLHGFLGKDVDT